jgi:geranylgeranyl diphosphate synthase type II
MKKMTEDKYGIYLDYINNCVSEYLPDSEYGQDIISDAMRYSVNIGGKRIRPVLTLEFCNLCCGDYKRAISFACAIEMIHTYSLIHDDLPCMDNDDIRRGQPSNHKKFGEANALLAGDALLTHAFSALSKAENISSDNIIKAVSVLSECAGVNGMIGGQVLDLKNEGKSVSAQELITTHNLKTGALIKAACILGCLAGNGNEEQIKAASDYAINIGLAFQVIDDILDVTGDEKTLGKPIGSDSENNKTTFVTLYGVDNSLEKAKEYTDKAVESLSVFDNDTSFLKELAFKLIDRKS